MLRSNPMKLFPIISLNLENSPYTQSDIAMLYNRLVEGVCAWVEQDDHIDYVDTLEFSLHNPYLFENLFDLHMTLEMSDMDMAFGSLVNRDQVIELERHLPSIIANQNIDPYKVFAPCYDEEILKLLAMNPVLSRFIEYIPGVYCQEDLDELPFASNEIKTLKIFPLEVEKPKDFLKLLQGPYPELRSEALLRRVIALDEELASQYDVYSKYGKNPDVVLITSPRDYHKIRHEFMLKQSMKLLLKPKQVDTQALVEAVKRDFPRVELVLAGIAGDMAKARKLKRVNALATKMFKYIILDILSGAIDAEQASKLIADELNKYSPIST